MWEIPLWECEIFDDVTFGKGLYLPSRYLSHLIITIRYFKLLLWTHFTSFFKRMSKPMYFILFETLTGKLCECICRNVCGTQLPYTHSDITLPDLIQMDVGLRRDVHEHTHLKFVTCALTVPPRTTGLILNFIYIFLLFSQHQHTSLSHSPVLIVHVCVCAPHCCLCVS